MNLIFLVVLFALAVVMAAKFSAVTGDWIEQRTGLDATIYKWLMSFFSLILVFILFRFLASGPLY